MNHTMKLYDQYFDMLKNSKNKNIEYRLNDEKRQKIKIGDHITFSKFNNQKKVIDVVVTDLKYYKTLLEMYTATFETDFKESYSSPQAVVDDTDYYTDDEVKKHGCVAIYYKKM